MRNHLKLVRDAAVPVIVFQLATASVLLAGQREGEITSSGTGPFSETWTAMQERDAATRQPGRPVSEAKTVAIIRPGWRRPRAAAPAGGSAAQATSSEDGVIRLQGPAPSAPQAIGTSFPTINLHDQSNGYYPPDTMGAVGPNHFMETINGSVAIYSKTGTRFSHVSLDSFFTVTVSGTTYPRGGSFEPRVLFDRRSNRWFASALELASTNNHIILAVCRTNDPTTGTWDKYVIPVGVAANMSISNALGTDDNGVYFGVTIASSSWHTKIAATARSPLTTSTPSLGTVYQWDNITDMRLPQPAHNHDPVDSTGLAWIISSSATLRANVHYRALSWAAGTPALSGTTVLSTPVFGWPLNAPAQGSVNIDVSDDQLSAAVVRNGRLWTCRNVGVNSTGGSSNPDRTGCEWLELDVSGSTASLVQNGRVYDSGSSPRFYYYPSIMVNGQGHVAMGFSGSKSTEYVGAYTCGRLAGDAPGTMGTITLIKSGDASYQYLDTSGHNLWGQYSAASLDPNDDMSIWTIQEYATNVASNTWGTWTARLVSPSPELTPASFSGNQGQTAIAMTLTGSGFYDPGPGYARRLGVTISAPGVLVGNVTYNGPGSVAITVDVAADAASGSYSIVLTNPDGQSATLTNGFTVLPARPVIGTFEINNGAATTASRTVTLNNACSGSPTEYMASERDDFPGATWQQPYSTAPAFLLMSAGNGVKTVWFKVRNAAGESLPVSDTITLAMPTGSVFAWGRNLEGECSVPAPNQDFTAVAAGALHSLGLKADGTIVAWGRNDSGECNVPSPNSGFIAIAAGGYHSMALRYDGSIAAWGRNASGECNVPSPNNSFIAIAAGIKHSVGLKGDRSVVVWGWNNEGQWNVPAPNSDFIAIAAGGYHTLGLRVEGESRSIVAWGYGGYGQLEVPESDGGYVTVGAGYEHSLGLRQDGSIAGWGFNEQGETDAPSPNSDFTAIGPASTAWHSIALKEDVVVTWGDNEYGQLNVPGPNMGFLAVAGGMYHSLGLKRCAAAVAADFNHDCAVDHSDAEVFESCATGPAVPHSGDCVKADFDHDGDVDQVDFAVFQRCYSGESMPADPDCS
jgi:hypothetical protein